MAQISHLQRIKASTADVFQAIATTQGITEWLTTACSDEFTQGGQLALRFPDESVHFTISTLEENARVTWHCISTESPWFNTTISFELISQGDITVVRFDHLGWSTVTDLFRDCSMSWAYFLNSLRLFVEEGRGTPEISNDSDA